MDEWSQRNVAAIAAIKNNAVHVHATSPDRDRLSYGSGLVLDRYHIVTHAHTVRRDDHIVIRTAEKQEYDATIVGYDPLYFLAILKTDRRIDSEPPVFLPTERLATGQIVLAVGNPLGEGVSASMGIISSYNRTIYRPERFPVDGLIITDALIHPGNMCGPLITLDGEVAGLNGIPWVHGLSLAIQAEVVQRVANQIIEYGAAIHPWLGFSGEPKVIDKALVNLFRLPVDRGIVVQHTNSEGPGSRAGIRPMDLVVRVADRPAVDLGFIRQVLSTYRLGDRVPLTLLRNGELIDVHIQVEEMPRLGSIEFDDDDDDE